MTTIGYQPSAVGEQPKADAGRVHNNAMAATLALQPEDTERAAPCDLEVAGQQVKDLDTLIYKQLSEIWKTMA